MNHIFRPEKGERYRITEAATWLPTGTTVEYVGKSAPRRGDNCRNDLFELVEDTTLTSGEEVPAGTVVEAFDGEYGDVDSSHIEVVGDD